MRVVNSWNSLPELVATAPSVNTFKGRRDAHWDDLKFAQWRRAMQSGRVHTNCDVNESIAAQNGRVFATTACPLRV